MKKALPSPTSLPSHQQAEFFLETLTPEGKKVLWEPLTAPDLEGLTLLLGEDGPAQRGIADKLIQKAAEKGLAPHRILSPGDPGNTAGLLLPERKLSAYCTKMAEEPDFLLPGVCEREIDCVGSPKEISADLKQRVFELKSRARQGKAQCVRLMRAAQILLRENDLRLLETVDIQKLEKSVQRIFRRECSRGRQGIEHKRFLTAMTGQGLCACRETVPLLADRAILVEDPFGAVAGSVMAVLREALLQTGQGFISCWSTLEPGRVEHLLLPDQRLCFLSASPLLPLPKLPASRRAIHYTRFAEIDGLEAQRQKIRFTRRMAEELLKEASAVTVRAFQEEQLAAKLMREALPEQFIESQTTFALELGTRQIELA